MTLPYITLFALSFLLLSFAGSLLVKTLTGISRFLKMSEYITAFLLMSFATSIPELSVGISSAIQGTSGLSFGNVLGANLIGLTLIIGLVVLIRGDISIESKISHTNFLLIFFISFLPILLATDGIISRGDASVLLLSFFIYLAKLLDEKEYFSKTVPGSAPLYKGLSSALGNMRDFILGVVLLIASSFLIVWTGSQMAQELGFSLVLFGIIFVAIGTTLPELVFGIKASAMDHPSMMFGNSLGSIAFNSAGIVGTVALISPIPVDFSTQGTVAISIFLFVAFVAFNIFSYTNNSISRKEGFMLVLLYALFLATQFL